MTSKLATLVLASVVALNGSPLLTASTAAPKAEQPVLSDWANALGMAGGLAVNDDLAAVDFWATGTVLVNGAPCRLTSYHVSMNYQVPSLRQELSCVDASGKTHQEIQSGAPNARLVQLWSTPLGLVKAATTGGAATKISEERGQTVVTFPVPGVGGATVRATLNEKHQAAEVDARVGATTIHTTYSDYSGLSDRRFYTSFPRHIVQQQGGITVADLTVTNVLRPGLDTGTFAATAPMASVAAPVPADVVRDVPSTWKDKKSFGKLDQSLRRMVSGGCDGPQSIIVRTKPGFRGGLRDSLQSHGNQVNAEFASINAVGASVSCNDLQALAGFDSTLSVSVNAKVVSSQSAEDSGEVSDLEGQAAAELQTPMLQTLLGDSYATLRSASPSGGSLGIAIIDSGIAPGPDFGERITAFYDFTSGDVVAADPSDAYGHGTHVAGLAASTYVGVNPHARLIGLKVLDAQGRGDSLNVLRAIEFAVLNKEALNIQVLNLSLGHPIYEPAATDPMVQAVESAVRAGLVVVVAAGNVGLIPHTLEPGYSGIVSPANAPSAFAIGAVRTHNTATRDDDQIALFSSRGPTRYDGFAKPDFSAPGQNVLSVAVPGSTLRQEQEAKGNTGNYMRLNGTSMAAGVVSGFATLMLQRNPGLTPNALKALLEYSSIDVNDLTYSGSADFLTQGTGEISGGALTLAAQVDPSVPVGAPWLTAGITPATTIAGVEAVWAQRMLWGNYPVSGPDVLNEQRPAWAAGTVWGNSLEEDDNIVWGNSLTEDLDNIVWGNSLAEDLDNIVWGNSLDDDNIVWGNSLDDDNIVWGNSLDDDNIVWGNSLDDDNIVWGNSLDDDDNIVWGNSVAGDIEDMVAVEPPTEQDSGRWLWSPGTSIVIRSTAVQTIVKRTRQAGGTN